MQTQNIVRVILWMTGTLLSFSVMAISIRLLAGRLSIFEILTLRTFGALVILSTLLVFRPSLRPDTRTERLPAHFLRSFIHFVGQYCWALALTILPFATVFAIEFTLPVWVLILAIFILGEKLTSGRIVVLVLGFIGALVILRPGLAAFQPASLLVLVSSLCYAIFNVYTKQMTATDTTFGIVFWMNLMQFPVALAGSDPLFFLKLEPWQIFPAIGVGVVGLSAHFCMAKAFGYGDASLVVPLDFLRLPLIALVGLVFYGETLKVWVMAGTALVLAAAWCNLKSAARPDPAQLIEE